MLTARKGSKTNNYKNLKSYLRNQKSIMINLWISQPVNQQLNMGLQGDKILRGTLSCLINASQYACNVMPTQQRPDELQP